MGFRTEMIRVDVTYLGKRKVRNQRLAFISYEYLFLIKVSVLLIVNVMNRHELLSDFRG